VGSGEDGSVGVDEEEEDHAEDHEVGVDAEEDAAVVPAPAGAHATDVIDEAGGGGEGGQSEEGGGVVLREVSQDEGRGKAEDDEQAAAQERSGARIEKVWLQLGVSRGVSGVSQGVFR